MSDQCVCGSLHPADSVCVHLLHWLHSEGWLMMEEIPFENYRCFFSPTCFCLVPPSLSLSLPLSLLLSLSLVVFSRVARSFLDSLMENHHHTGAKFLLLLLSLSQSDKSLGLQLLDFQSRVLRVHHPTHYQDQPKFTTSVYHDTIHVPPFVRRVFIQSVMSQRRQT